LCKKAGCCFFTTSTDVGQFLNFHYSFPDELPVPGFRENSIYSPVSKVPNRVALDLEVIAANFGYYSEAGILPFTSAFIGHAAIATVHWLCPHAGRHHTPLAMSNRLPTNHSWTGGCASSHWEDGRPAENYIDIGHKPYRPHRRPYRPQAKSISATGRYRPQMFSKSAFIVIYITLKLYTAYTSGIS